MNETELKNKELLQKAEEARATSVKALNEAKQERQRAERAREESAKAEARQKQEAQRRYEAERETRAAKGGERLTRERYKALFIGIVVFTITIAILTAYSRRSVFGECGRWFADRWSNLLSFFSWLWGSFVGIAGFFAGQFESLHIAWCYVIAVVIFAAVAVGLYFGFRWLFETLRDKIQAIKREYTDGEFKAILTASIAISLFYVCLFLYEPIKSVVPFNIFSVWLLLSLIGAVVVNWQEIARGVRNG